VRTSFVYCLAVKDEDVKIIRSNLHLLLWLCTRFSFVNQCSLWYCYLVIICDVMNNMVVLDEQFCWTRPDQNGPDLIKFHLIKLQLGPTKSFSAIWTTSAYRNSFGLNPATNGPNSFYDAYDLSQLACHIRFCPAWQSCRTELMTHCIDDFSRVIKLMTPRNKVSSLIAVCDTRLMTECFCNNRHH
jgi:hypothetical protein